MFACHLIHFCVTCNFQCGLAFKVTIYIQFGGTLLYNQNCPKLQISLKSNFISMFRNTIQLIRIKLEKQELQSHFGAFISWVFYGNFNHCFVFYKRNCSSLEQLFKVIPQWALTQLIPPLPLDNSMGCLKNVPFETAAAIL